MKKELLIYSAVGLLLSAPASAQVLKTESHCFNDGDELVKQELEYKSPGRSGKDVVWNFSELAVIDAGYTETFMSDENHHIYQCAPRSVYEYGLQGDSLVCWGYQADNVQVNYFQPQLQLKFPVSYGDSLSNCFYGEGLYSKRLYMSVYGKSERKADAHGILILPDDVCLQKVLRIHERNVLGQRISSDNSALCTDSLAACEIENVMAKLAEDSITWQTDTYRWYVEGSRYPVFETVEVDILRPDGQRVPHYKRSWQYHANNVDIVEHDTEGVEEVKTQKNLSFNHFWSDNQKLTVEFYLSGADSNVDIQLTTLQGIVVSNQHLSSLPGGFHSEVFDLSNHPSGVYILSIKVNNETISEKILKN